jgi:hypothetical protein
MSNFPLYDSLVSDTTHDDITVKQKDEFMKLVKKMDAYGHELLYVLIRVYQIENSDDKSTFKTPYGGKFVKTDLKFDLNELPNQLKQVLFKFAQKHSSSMIENKNKNKT